MPDATPRSKTLLQLAAPLALSFTLRFFFQAVDLVYARSIDDAAVAAIGFWTPFNGVMIAIWVGLSAGFTSSLSAAFGRRDEDRIRSLKAGILKILFALVPVLTLSGVAMWFAVPHMGLEPDLAEAFRIYATTLCLGMPLASFWSIHPDSIVKAHHDTRSTMNAGFIATGTNILLNALFVLVLDFGVFGLALGTVLSRISSLLYAIRRARALEAGRVGPEWEPKPGGDEQPWPPATRAILALSVPAALTFLLTAAETSVINGLLVQVENSTAAIAAMAVYSQLLMLSIMPTIGVSVAVVPFVARNVAEGQLATVAANVRQTMFWCAVSALSVTFVAGVLFPEQLGAFFLKDEESEGVPEVAITILRLLPLAALAALPFTILRPIFEALQKPRLGVVVSVLRFLVFSIPLLFVGRWAAPSLGLEPLTGIVAATIVAAALASVTTYLLARRLQHGLR